MTRGRRWCAVAALIGCCAGLVVAARADAAKSASQQGDVLTAATTLTVPGADLLTDAASFALGIGQLYPALFGGVWIDRERGLVNVALTAAAPLLEPIFIGPFDAALFRFPQVQRSWVTLTGLRDLVLAQEIDLRGGGIDLRAFYPKASLNKVVLEVVDPTDGEIARIHQAFGADAVTVVAVADLPGMPGADRLTDSPAWNGGDFITSRYEGTCTSGPPAHRQSDGREFLVTGGHCWPVGRYVYNERNYPDGAGGHAVVGRTVYSDYGTHGGLDAAIIDSQNYGGSSWLNWRNFNVSAAQQQWSDPPENGSICLSGAYEMEKCGATVTDVDMCKYYVDDRTTHCHQSRAVNYNTTLVGQGDSGGPVYSVDTRTLKLRIYGEFSYLEAAPGGTLYACPTLSAPGDPRYCAHIAYFTDIVPVLMKYGLSLNR
jgi:hypothetical protein